MSALNFTRTRVVKRSNATNDVDRLIGGVWMFHYTT